MRIFLLLLIILVLADVAHGMIVPGATEDGIRNDCAVTAEVAVMLLRMKAKTAPDQLLKAATTILAEKGYKGSFGEAAFIAGIYTGLALQMGSGIDPEMAAASPEDLELMTTDHEISCLGKAIGELDARLPSTPPTPH